MTNPKPYTELGNPDEYGYPGEGDWWVEQDADEVWIEAEERLSFENWKREILNETS